MRYLGMSLGYAIALGFCAAFGTIIPPIFMGTMAALLRKASGLTVLAGVAVCLCGIALCGRAGMSKEKELSAEQRRATIKEFSFVKGLLVAVFAGVMSSCMAFGIAAGKPIANLAVEHGVRPLWQNSLALVVVLAGGFTTNFIWCVILNIRNHSGKDYLTAGDTRLASNYFFSAVAGITWYLQFMFYGMGTTKMGKYDFSSWTLHMAFIIVFSNIWSLRFREWKGCSRRTLTIIVCGILVVVLSTILIGAGNFIASLGK
jgi:L-rhamnose-H+ transport protein